MHKDKNLGIMTDVGKNRLVKVIFTNIRKISDVCANSFGRYLMIAQCMRNAFTFYSILWENGVSEKIKAHLPQHPGSLQQLFSPHLINFIPKMVFPFSLPPLHYLKKRAETLHSIRDIMKEKRQSSYHSI